MNQLCPVENEPAATLDLCTPAAKYEAPCGMRRRIWAATKRAKKRELSMSIYKKVSVAAFAAVLPVLACGSANAADAVAAVVADVARPPADMERDVLRKPASVLALSTVKAGDKIAELIPGNGYYTRMLSRLIGPRGQIYPIVPYVGANPQIVREQGKDARSTTPIAAALAVQDIADYRNVTVLWENLGQYGGHMSTPVQLDAVLSEDTYHLLHNAEIGRAHV